MINNNGLIGDPRRITFNESIKKTMPIKQLMQSFLGCAVVYKGEDTYINDVKMNTNYDFYFRHADMFLFELDNGEKPTTNVDLKLYKSDLNDDLESVIDRMNSIEHDYNLFSKNENPINITSKLDVDYSNSEFDKLSKLISNNKFDTYLNEAVKDFLSIFNSLKKLTVEFRNNSESKLGVRTVVIDVNYQPNPTIDYVGNKIHLDYSDIKIKLAGVEKFIPLTASNIKFFYKHQPLTFEELLEKHNSGEIK